MFFFSSRRRHTRCALVTGVQTCALPICSHGQSVSMVGPDDIWYKEGRIAVGLPDRISSLGQSGVRREPGPPRADQEEPASASITYLTVCNGTRTTLHSSEGSRDGKGWVRTCSYRGLTYH